MRNNKRIFHYIVKCYFSLQTLFGNIIVLIILLLKTYIKNIDLKHKCFKILIKALLPSRQFIIQLSYDFTFGRNFRKFRRISAAPSSNRVAVHSLSQDQKVT